MYGEQVQTKGFDTPEISRPAMADFGERLQSAVNRFDGLTIELKQKLQTIKRIDEPISAQDGIKEKQPDCVMDELNRLLWKINDYNERLEGCLRHFNQIV